jgi:hypothetical protein
MHPVKILAVGIIGISMAGIAIAQTVSEAKVSETISLGFEQDDLGAPPQRWFVPTKGWKAELTEEHASDGEKSAKMFLPEASDAPFGNLMRALDVQRLQGKHVRLSASIRVEGAGGRAQMWLRVDRPNRQVGFFDNMNDRPIRVPRWSDAVIEGDIEGDAVRVVCGVISYGGGSVYIDDVKITVTSDAVPAQQPSPPAPLSDRGLANLRAASRLLAYVRFFHPSDEVVATKAWDAFVIELMEAAEPARDASDLAQRLQDQCKVVAPGLSIWAGDENDEPELQEYPDATSFRYWVHHGAGLVARNPGVYSSATKTIKRDDLDAKGEDADERPKDPLVTKSLGGGVMCRLPIMVAIGPSGSLPKATQENRWKDSPGSPKWTSANRSTRLAGVAICWGVMQHFYPYFDVVDTDWQEALDVALRQAAEDTDEQSYLQTLQELVAKLRDGHGGVYSQRMPPRKRLPVLLAWAGSDCVVVGKHESLAGDLEAGDAIVAIDEKQLSVVCDELSSSISAATDGFRRYVLLRMLTMRDDSDTCRLRMRKPDGSEYDVSLPPIGSPLRITSQIKKPNNGAQLAEGIVYFDLNRAKSQALDEAMETLEKADGIVFDLRGYPADAAIKLLPLLIDDRAASARWNVPVVTMPDGQAWAWKTSAWDLQPDANPLKAEIAFLTDGRAISYAESIMAIVEHYKLGEIVGATTAGTNGNVNPFSLPGGYNVSWTGMKVLKHDGSQHHGVGVQPTVPIEPTAKGISEGRDEVLEKAVKVLQQHIDQD